jgi:hypothetical protein
VRKDEHVPGGAGRVFGKIHDLSGRWLNARRAETEETVPALTIHKRTVLLCVAVMLLDERAHLPPTLLLRFQEVRAILIGMQTRRILAAGTRRRPRLPPILLGLSWLDARHNVPFGKRFAGA